jgi:hypothetical protein
MKSLILNDLMLMILKTSSIDFRYYVKLRFSCKRKNVSQSTIDLERIIPGATLSAMNNLEESHPDD